MIIQQNSIAGQVSVDYNRTMRAFANTTSKLSTGLKQPDKALGASTTYIADQIQNHLRTDNVLKTGIEASKAYAAAQNSVLDSVSEGLFQLSELIASANQPGLTSAERTSFDTQKATLVAQINSYASQTLNGQNLFGNSKVMQVRYGQGTSEIYSFASVDLGTTLDMSALDLTSSTNAAKALVSIDTFMNKVAELRTIVGANERKAISAENLMDVHTNGLSNREASLRYIDVATETAAYTAQQVTISAAQSVLAQANRIPEGAMRFFG